MELLIPLKEDEKGRKYLVQRNLIFLFSLEKVCNLEMVTFISTKVAVTLVEKQVILFFQKG